VGAIRGEYTTSQGETLLYIAKKDKGNWRDGKSYLIGGEKKNEATSYNDIKAWVGKGKTDKEEGKGCNAHKCRSVRSIQRARGQKKGRKKPADKQRKKSSPVKKKPRKGGKRRWSGQIGA